MRKFFLAFAFLLFSSQAYSECLFNDANEATAFNNALALESYFSSKLVFINGCNSIEITGYYEGNKFVFVLSESLQSKDEKTTEQIEKTFSFIVLGFVLTTPLLLLAGGIRIIKDIIRWI